MFVSSTKAELSPSLNNFEEYSQTKGIEAVHGSIPARTEVLCGCNMVISGWKRIAKVSHRADFGSVYFSSKPVYVFFSFISFNKILQHE